MSATTRYHRPRATVYGSRILNQVTRFLTANARRRLHEAVFGVYRRLTRLFYLRRWLTRVISGDRAGRVKVEQVFSVMPYSLVGWRGLEVTRDLVADLSSRGVPGALVECGVARGGCVALMALASANHGPARMIWAFDSFEGLPDPTPRDFRAGDARTGVHLRPLERGSCLGTLDDVRTLLFETFAFSTNTIRLVRGWFQDTLPGSREVI